MIEFVCAGAGYSAKNIIESVSFTAAPAEITVILGKNGTGKSTLLRAASGSLKYSGSIKIDGVETRELSAARRAKMLSVMPQLLRSPGITVRELVSCGRQPYTGMLGILSKDDRNSVEKLIYDAGLYKIADSRLDSISGGELQKAYFAMLLAQDTPNLMLDEPTSHLDAEYLGSLSSFLTSAKNKGKTVLAVLHDINFTLTLADKIVFISEGKAAFTGSAEEFVHSRTAERIFGMKSYRCVDENGENRIFYQ